MSKPTHLSGELFSSLVMRAMYADHDKAVLHVFNSMFLIVAEACVSLDVELWAVSVSCVDVY